MKRTVCLMVAVLGLALVLQAEETGKRKNTQDRHSGCSSESENRAGRDQDRGSEAVAADDQATAEKTAGENMEGTHMGKNMGSAKEQKKKTTWSYFNYEYE